MIANLKYDIYPIDDKNEQFKRLFVTFSYDDQEDRMPMFDMFIKYLIPKYGINSTIANSIGEYIRPYLVDQNGIITRESQTVGGTNIPDEEFSNMIEDFKQMPNLKFELDGQEIDVSTKDKIDELFNKLKNNNIENLIMANMNNNEKPNEEVKTDPLIINDLENLLKKADTAVEKQIEKIETVDENPESDLKINNIENNIDIADDEDVKKDVKDSNLNNEKESKNEDNVDIKDNIDISKSKDNTEIKEDKKVKKTTQAKDTNKIVDKDLNQMTIEQLEEELKKINQENENRKQIIEEKEAQIKKELINKINSAKREIKSLDKTIDQLDQRLESI